MNNKKKFLLIGFQKAALKNLKESIYFFFKKKVLMKNAIFFCYNEKKKKNFLLSLQKKEYLKKKIKDFQLILGTSETSLECEIFNYLVSINYQSQVYVDSITNIKLRFKNFFEFPKKIIVNNNLILSRLRKELGTKLINSKFLDIKMIYQRMLKKKFFSKNRKDKKFLYLTSDIGIKNEFLNIKKLLSFSKSFETKKKIIIAVHPRENLRDWKFYFRKENLIFITQNKNYYDSRDIKRVFGVSTMALINYKFCGFKTFFFERKISKRDSFDILLNNYNIQKVKF